MYLGAFLHRAVFMFFYELFQIPPKVLKSSKFTPYFIYLFCQLNNFE